MKMANSKSKLLIVSLGLVIFVSLTFNAASEERRVATELLLFEEIPTVITAAKYEQPITEAPSTISVITAEEIRQSGIRNIPELLKILPGIDVIVSKASQTDVGVRGDITIAYNSLLVLIDGRSVYQGFYGMTAWQHLEIGIEEIERIEVIRGPGSALYGANAFTGVVNIITKSPEDMQGTLIATHGGNFRSREAEFYHAGNGDSLGYKISGGWKETGRWNMRSDDSLDVGRFNGVVEYKLDEESKLSLAGGVNTGESELFLGVLGGTYDSDADVSYVKAEYTSSDMYIRAFWNRTRLEADRQGAPAIRINVLSNVSDLEFQHSFRFDCYKPHRVTWGASYRYNTIASGQLDTGHKWGLFAAYLQDEMRLNDKLLFNLGVRFDHHPLTSEVSPRGSLIYTPKEDHIIRLSAGTSFRAPSYVELYSNTRLGLMSFFGNSDLDSEEIESYEVGYEFPMYKKRLKGKVNLFYNEMDKVIANTRISVFPPMFRYFNTGKKNTRGCEAGLDFLITDWLSGFANYTYQRVKEAGINADDQTAPEHKVNLGLRCNLTNGFNASITAHYVDTYETDIPRGKVDSYTLVNGRVGYKFAKQDAEIALAVYNLLHDKHRQYSTADEIGTKVTLSMGYKF